MELRHLIAFDAVARHARIARAARELVIAVSVLSRQIRALEDELRVALFHRHGQEMILTDAGAHFHRHVRQTLQIIHAARTAMSEYAGLLRGTIRLAVSPSTTVFGLPQLLAGFSQHHPQLTIAISELGRSAIPTALLKGEIDIALTSAPPADRRLSAVALQREEMVLAYAANHPLRQTLRQIALHDLRSIPWVLPDEDTDVHHAVQAACQRAGFTPHAAINGGGLPMVISCVSAGLGVTLLPHSVTQRTAGLIGRPLREFHLETGVWMVTVADGLPNPAPAQLYRYLLTQSETNRESS